MKNFLYKEIKLCLAPINYIYLAFAIMAMIPNYPKYVPFFFFCVSVFQLFNNALLNKDLQYSMILPITKKDIVKSRCILISLYEIFATILTIPFGIIFNVTIPQGNVSGIESNCAFYGLALILITIFNFTFFTSYYKKADKPGLPFVKGTIVFWIFYLILEFPIWTKDIFNIGWIQMLDKIDSVSLIQQLPILFVGIIVFVLGWILTFKVSAKRFEKVDL